MRWFATLMELVRLVLRLFQRKEQSDYEDQVEGIADDLHGHMADKYDGLLDPHGNVPANAQSGVQRDPAPDQPDSGPRE